MDVNQVLVEAGSFLTSNILSSTYWDELVLYIAPKIMGKDARSAIQVSSPEYLERVTKLELIDSSFLAQMSVSLIKNYRGLKLCLQELLVVLVK